MLFLYSPMAGMGQLREKVPYDIFEDNGIKMDEERDFVLDYPYGAILHIQSVNPSNLKHVVEALVLANVKVVNIHIYSYVHNLDIEAALVKLLNDAGIDVLFRYLWIPRYKTIANVKSELSVSVDQWEKYLLKTLLLKATVKDH